MELSWLGNALNISFLDFLRPEIQNLLEVVSYYCSFIPLLFRVGGCLSQYVTGN